MPQKGQVLSVPLPGSETLGTWANAYLTPTRILGLIWSREQEAHPPQLPCKAKGGKRLIPGWGLRKDFPGEPGPT